MISETALFWIKNGDFTIVCRCLLNAGSLRHPSVDKYSSGIIHQLQSKSFRNSGISSLGLYCQTPQAEEVGT